MLIHSLRLLTLVYLVYKNLLTDLMTANLKHWLSYRPTNMYVVRSTLSSELIFCSARSSVFAEHADVCTFSPKSPQFDHKPCRPNVCKSSKSAAFIYNPNESDPHSCILISQVVSTYVHFPSFHIYTLSLDSIHAGRSSNIHWRLAYL